MPGRAPLLGQVWRQAGFLFVILSGAAILLVCTFMGILLHYAVTWARCRLAGVRVSYVSVLRMRLRGVAPMRILGPVAKAARRGCALDWAPFVVHDRRNGNVRNVVEALIAAHDWDMELAADRACALDLAGVDVLAAVEKAHERGDAAVTGEVVDDIRQHGA